MTTSEHPSLHFTSVNVGQSVTLQCACLGDAEVMFFWYKQTMGLAPQLISTYYLHNVNVTFHGEFKNKRFSLITENRQYHLKISDFQTADSATYHCIGSNLYVLQFCKSITVTVRDSDLHIQATVYKSVSETIQPDYHRTLSCTVHTGSCDGEHSVYWFRSSEASHPALIYTDGGRNDQCVREENSQTQTCVYNLLSENLNLSEEETLYCAVASCGHILFGNRTEMLLKGDTSVWVNILGGALAFTSILVIILTFLVCRIKNQLCRCSAESSPSTMLPQDAENLHYAAVSVHRASRSRTQNEDPTGGCVYSTLRH
ncbi:uncharacterized protein LOC141784476 [Halichoeres trimaculatus]|uniref:uncharacterized protein LOC141784476 n=1 Tax=Halichoeres trimaculatus TaxID=147232 RepID=UPI003D9DC95A